MTSSPGQHAKIYVMTRHESVAAWGELQEKQTEDDGWQKFVDEGFLGKDAILVHNSFSRSVFRVL